jgi:predicted molibdopterin-dependent oxidoreductase YjgC
VLIPGRQLRTLNSALRDTAAHGGRLDTHLITVHPDDAASAGVNDGDEVLLRSENGRCVGRIRIDSTIRLGTVHVPHAWDTPGLGFLTSDTRHVDGLTGMPQLTGVPVEISRWRSVDAE